MARFISSENCLINPTSDAVEAILFCAAHVKSWMNFINMPLRIEALKSFVLGRIFLPYPGLIFAAALFPLFNILLSSSVYILHLFPRPPTRVGENK